MPSVKMNYFAVDVEITTMSTSSISSLLMFNPNNPYIKNHYSPLPFFSNNQFNYRSLHNGQLYWIIEEELTIDSPALDLKKAFNCFNQIASSGAKYTIKLCAD